MCNVCVFDRYIRELIYYIYTALHYSMPNVNIVSSQTNIVFLVETVHYFLRLYSHNKKIVYLILFLDRHIQYIFYCC